MRTCPWWKWPSTVLVELAGLRSKFWSARRNLSWRQSTIWLPPITWPTCLITTRCMAAIIFAWTPIRMGSRWRTGLILCLRSATPTIFRGRSWESMSYLSVRGTSIRGLRCQNILKPEPSGWSSRLPPRMRISLPSSMVWTRMMRRRGRSYRAPVARRIAWHRSSKSSIAGWGYKRRWWRRRMRTLPVRHWWMDNTKASVADGRLRLTLCRPSRVPRWRRRVLCRTSQGDFKAQPSECRFRFVRFPISWCWRNRKRVFLRWMTFSCKRRAATGMPE